LTLLPANAATVANLGINPTSATGAFSHSVGGGNFNDQVLFTLAGGPAFLTIASVTNVYPESSDFITGFQGSVLFLGANGVLGGGDDQTVIGPINATPCPAQPACQGFAGSAILTLVGNYALNLTGIGGGTSGYGGNLAVAQVPIPAAAWLFGAGVLGLGALSRKRKKKVVESTTA
jgi:hypothetical protein